MAFSFPLLPPLLPFHSSLCSHLSKLSISSEYDEYQIKDLLSSLQNYITPSLQLKTHNSFEFLSAIFHFYSQSFEFIHNYSQDKKFEQTLSKFLTEFHFSVTISRLFWKGKGKLHVMVCVTLLFLYFYYKKHIF
jgi:hypothetical protein